MIKYITTQNVSTTDQELLELYEQRYKPAILAADESNAEASASTNYSYLLESEGLSVIQAEADAAFSETGQRPLYLATPTGQGGTEGIDLSEEPAGHAADVADEEAEAEPDSCPLLTEGDHELLDGLRQYGHAAALTEIAPYAGASIERLTGGNHPENGVAFLRDHRGYTLAALGGATTADLRKAANRADADAIGATFEAMVSRAGSIHRKLVGRLIHLGGSSSLTAAVGSLLALGHPRAAIRSVIAESHRRGEVRISARGASPQPGQRDSRARFITLMDAGEGALANAAKRYGEDCKEIPARLAEAKATRIGEGQDKGFLAPFVPFGGTRVDPIEQRRALYVERAKARYKDSSSNPIGPRGVSEVTLALAGFCDLATGKEYPAEEHTLYSATAEADSPQEFFRARIRGRILNGLHKRGSLTARTIISTLFPERAAEIFEFLSEGRTMSPQLAAPYDLFTAAARELMEEGKVRHTGKAFMLAEPSETKLPTAAELAAGQATEWADEDPEPEQESGPDPHGADKYAADQPGAHDCRAIATGPRAPSTRPRKRRRTAGELRAIREGKDPDAAAANAEANAERANLRAQANRAWREALAVHMAALDEADRLELHLQLHGPQRFERMVEAAEEPGVVFRAARALYEKGRITVEKGERYTLLGAATARDRDALSRALLRIMARGEMAVPEGTRLGRRVRATKAAMTRETSASERAS